MAQSKSTGHRWEHTLPPQSTPVSSPSCIPLKHDVHTASSCPHCSLTQSSDDMHAFESSQRSQAQPPQSTSVSLPLRMPSEQLMQLAAKQSPLAQSSLVVQAEDSGQTAPTPRHAAPPQSTPVSSPSMMPLLHVSTAVSARHRDVAASHLDVEQSVSSMQ